MEKIFRKITPNWLSEWNHSSWKRKEMYKNYFCGN